jgi:murein DD-endopeptidase MepM/ murein hydrolase activator NlpD
MKKLIFILLSFVNILTLGSSDLNAEKYIQQQQAKEFKIQSEINDYNIIKSFDVNFVEFTRISSPYTFKRLHPVFNIYRPHLGVDLAAPKGTEVKSPYSGTISWMGYIRGAGHTIEIQHNNIYRTSYLHLSSYNPNLKIGEQIDKGTIIGCVGSSGHSTGPHLDFRLYIHNIPVDPVEILKLKVSQSNNNQQEV